MDQRQHQQQPLTYQFRRLLEVVTGGCLEIPVIMFTTTLHQLRTIMDIEVIPQFSAMVEREQQEKAVLFTIMVDLFKLLVTVNSKVKHFLEGNFKFAKPLMLGKGFFSKFMKIGTRFEIYAFLHFIMNAINKAYIRWPFLYDEKLKIYSFFLRNVIPSHIEIVVLS